MHRHLIAYAHFEKNIVLQVKMTPVGFEPTPFRTGAFSQRLRPLGQSVMGGEMLKKCLRFQNMGGLERGFLGAYTLDFG